MPTYAPAHSWIGGGTFDVDIVGEASNQKNLRSCVEDLGAGGVEQECQALLIPEPNNPHDKNAIIVAIDGKLVGYLPRSRAAEYQEALEYHGLGRRPIGVAAMIVGGWLEADGRRANFGVRLDMDWPPEPDPPGPLTLSRNAGQAKAHSQDAPAPAATPGKPAARPMWQRMITREPLDTETMLLVEQRVANERKSSLLAYLLWFFLGWAGAHRYYLGRFGSGILQLLLFVFGTATFVLGIGVILLGIWGFWALIDLILIPMMVDDHTRTVRRRHERRLGK